MLQPHLGTVQFDDPMMQVVVERCPAEVLALQLELSECVTVLADQQPPYFIKATQVDGQMAWASPVYVSANRF